MGGHGKKGDPAFALGVLVWLFSLSLSLGVGSCEQFRHPLFVCQG